jgi:glutamine synthetase
MTEAERREYGIDTLPGSLAEAIEAARDSELLRRCLGDHLHDSLLLNKRIEWSKFRAHVTDWEKNRYLAIL